MVRTRSDEKRREIIRVAAETFQELGYERTSMLTIAERMRGSKQTLYNYFASKEDLLRAVLDFDVGEVADQALGNFVPKRACARAWRDSAKSTSRASSPRWRFRTFAIVATQPAEVGDRRGLLSEHPLRGVEAGRGRLQRSSWSKASWCARIPWLAAMHFKGLVLQDFLERQLLNAAKATSPKVIETAAKQAADAFLKIYGEDGAPGKGSAIGALKSARADAPHASEFAASLFREAGFRPRSLPRPDRRQLTNRQLGQSTARRT